MALNHNRKPRILLLIDSPNWAFHTIALAIVKGLSNKFEFEIQISSVGFSFDDSAYDLIHIFFEYEQAHLPFIKGNCRILKSVYSHYWQEAGMTPMEFYEKHLREAHAISVPSMKLLHALKDIPPIVYLCPEGVDTTLFTAKNRQNTGPIIIGWAGNPTRDIKRLDWLQEACEGICELKIAPGNMNQVAMIDFYNSIDVIACSSRAEGSPRPLIEGMSSGCFPISFNVGIADELITNEINGLLIENETPEGLRNAIVWCCKNVEKIRDCSGMNAEIARTQRDWNITLPYQEKVYEKMLQQKNKIEQYFHSIET